VGYEPLLELRGDGDRGRWVRGGICLGLGLGASPRFEGDGDGDRDRCVKREL
jgi:hypothetical protein